MLAFVLEGLERASRKRRSDKTRRKSCTAPPKAYRAKTAATFMARTTLVEELEKVPERGPPGPQSHVASAKPAELHDRVEHAAGEPVARGVEEKGARAAGHDALVPTRPLSIVRCMVSGSPRSRKCHQSDALLTPHAVSPA